MKKNEPPKKIAKKAAKKQVSSKSLAKGSGRKKEDYNLTFDSYLKECIKTYCDVRGRSASDLANQLFGDFLEKEGFYHPKLHALEHFSDSISSVDMLGLLIAEIGKEQTPKQTTHEQSISTPEIGLKQLLSDVMNSAKRKQTSRY